MAGHSNCPILLLPLEQMANLCGFLTPDAVCNLEDASSEFKEKMNQESIWKKQVESFPVAGMAFGDSNEARFNKLGKRRGGNFNDRLLKFFTRRFNGSGGVKDKFGYVPGMDGYRIAIRTKFTIDKMLGEIKDFVANELDEALAILREEARESSDRACFDTYPLKMWCVKVELEQPEKWNFECRDYICKWIAQGRIIPRRLDWKMSYSGNLFKIESYGYHGYLMADETDSDNETVSVDSESEADDAEEESVEEFE